MEGLAGQVAPRPVAVPYSNPRFWLAGREQGGCCQWYSVRRRPPWDVQAAVGTPELSTGCVS